MSGCFTILLYIFELFPNTHAQKLVAILVRYVRILGRFYARDLLRVESLVTFSATTNVLTKQFFWRHIVWQHSKTMIYIYIYIFIDCLCFILYCKGKAKYQQASLEGSNINMPSYTERGYKISTKSKCRH